MNRARAAKGVALALYLAGRAALAQVGELRVDGFAGRTPGVQAGAGIALDAGLYTRLALDVGAGVQRVPGGALRGAQRVEGVARFHVDPLRTAHTGLYAAGGVAVRRAAQEKTRVALVGLLGFEGRPHGGTALALEAGIGGGARVGLVARRARKDRR